MVLTKSERNTVLKFDGVLVAGGIFKVLDDKRKYSESNRVCLILNVYIFTPHLSRNTQEEAVFNYCLDDRTWHINYIKICSKYAAAFALHIPSGNSAHMFELCGISNF